MTRKDYEKMATVIRSHRKDDDGTSSAVIASIAIDLAQVFATDNPRFDRARFFGACGLDTDGAWAI